MSGRRLIFAATLAALPAACAGSEESAVESAPDCTAEQLALTWENWGAGFFTGYCRTCHSVDTPNRLGAPESMNFDSLAEVSAAQEAIRLSVIVDQTMPVGGGVAEAELERLASFLDCGL